MSSSGFLRRNTTNDICAIFEHLLSMKSSLLSGKTLDDNLKIKVKTSFSKLFLKAIHWKPTLVLRLMLRLFRVLLYKRTEVCKTERIEAMIPWTKNKLLIAKETKVELQEKKNWPIVWHNAKDPQF